MHVLMHLGMFYHVYTNLAALSDVNCLFSDVVYLGVQVAGFDTIFDCITNMIGRFFYLQIAKSTPLTKHAKDWVL